MIFLTFFTAIALSVVAEYYSVVGLATIFPGAFWPVVLMGGTLGLAKLVTVSWLYRNWTTSPFFMKSYLSVATIILMLITSMGIFGYLSKAHLEHSVDNAPLVERLAVLDERIKTEKENIDVNRKAIKQYDEVVDQTMGRTTDEKGTDKAQAIRRSQQKDRIRILQEIKQSQEVLAKYSEERSPISNEFKKVEADIGPIKYIAALVYDEKSDSEFVDRAVRLVILLIIVVFDPLAILLLIAANMTLLNSPKKVFISKEQIWPIDKPVEPVPEKKEVKEEVVTKKDTVVIDKENIDNIVIDGMSGESIPPIGKTNEQHKKLEPKYDYDASYSFREKRDMDGGKF